MEYWVSPGLCLKIIETEKIDLTYGCSHLKYEFTGKTEKCLNCASRMNSVSCWKLGFKHTKLIKILHTNSIPSSDTKVLELLTMDLNWFKEVYSDYRRKKDDAILWNAVGLYGFRAYINHSLLGSFLEYAKVFLEKGIL